MLLRWKWEDALTERNLDHEKNDNDEEPYNSIKKEFEDRIRAREEGWCYYIKDCLKHIVQWNKDQDNRKIKEFFRNMDDEHKVNDEKNKTQIRIKEEEEESFRIKEFLIRCENISSTNKITIQSPCSLIDDEIKFNNYPGVIEADLGKEMIDIITYFNDQDYDEIMTQIIEHQEVQLMREQIYFMSNRKVPMESSINNPLFTDEEENSEAVLIEEIGDDLQFDYGENNMDRFNLMKMVS